MQDVMTAAIIAITVLFTAVATVDFATGLVAAWHNAGAQPQAESTVQEQAIAPQVEPAPAPQKVATLEWIERNMPPLEIYSAELPDAIAMAKSRLPKVAAPVIQLATRQQLIDLGIRRCKKLASQIGVRNYSSLRLAQLADNLVGKIALSDLVA